MKSLWGRPSGDDEREEREEQRSVVQTDRDPRLRPPDPAGTQPKFDPRELRPHTREPLLTPPPPPVDVGFEEGDREVLPARTGGGQGVPVGAVASSPSTPRFQFALGALIACALAALVAAVAIVATNGSSKGSPSAAVTDWSAWRPVGGQVKNPATQIAEHVGREYRLPDGAQLVAVTGGGMTIAGLPLYPALRNTAGDINIVEGNGVLFRLCGLGPKCAIPTGEASAERHLLLRREALELALYSFRYLDTDYAVIFMPPAVGEDPSQALYIPRTEVAQALNRPLNATLADRTPSVATVTQSPDAQFVQNLTTRQLFTVSGFTQGNQDDRAFLVLESAGG